MNIQKEIDGIRARYGLSLSEGNKKLVPAPGKHNFLIFNLPAVITCPHATASCIKFCYALKAERIYKNAVAARLANYELSKTADFVPVMLELIGLYMRKPRYKDIPCYFRIHESGDFYSKEYFNKWLKIVDACRVMYPNLYFCFYTKSVPFISETTQAEFIARHPNLTPNISLWSDSPADTVNFAISGNWNIYTAATPADIDNLLKNPVARRCQCSDCGACKMCLINHKTNITKICEIH